MNGNVLSVLETDRDVTSSGFKLQVPKSCTTSRKGPLLLQSSTLTSADMTDRHSMCSTLPPLPSSAFKTKRGSSHIDPQQSHSLTRFPILWIRRPIEEVEEQLIGLSCAELQDNVQNLDIFSHNNKPVQLPSLQHKSVPSQYYIPAAGDHHETYTHFDTGPMDITITFTRQPKQTTPFNQSQFKPLPQSRTIDLSHGTRRGKLPYPSLAPPSLNALIIHHRQPITSNTWLRGTKLY